MQARSVFPFVRRFRHAAASELQICRVCALSTIKSACTHAYSSEQANGYMESHVLMTDFLLLPRFLRTV
jgi:hypothetical protein